MDDGLETARLCGAHGAGGGAARPHVLRAAVLPGGGRGAARRRCGGVRGPGAAQRRSLARRATAWSASPWRAAPSGCVASSTRFAAATGSGSRMSTSAVGRGGTPRRRLRPGRPTASRWRPTRCCRRGRRRAGPRGAAALSQGGRHGAGRHRRRPPPRGARRGAAGARAAALRRQAAARSPPTTGCAFVVRWRRCVSRRRSAWPGSRTGSPSISRCSMTSGSLFMSCRTGRAWGAAVRSSWSLPWREEDEVSHPHARSPRAARRLAGDVAGDPPVRGAPRWR